MSPPILQIEPWIDETELEFLSNSIRTKYVTEHAYTKRFEEEISTYTGSPHAVAMTNGTAALYCAFKALGLVPGDEVLVPNLTFVATANAAIMAGLVPVFVDVDPDFFCIDPDKARRAITARTRAIVPVHLYGNSANVEAIAKLAQEHGLFVVEDAAQGMGVKHLGQHVGTFGDIGILSFYGNKTITCGEGGVVLTKSQDLRDKCYRLKNHGRDKKGVFIHEEIGFNFSFTEMQAAVGLAQMTKLPWVIQRKKDIHQRYVKELTDLPWLKFCKVRPETTTPVFWFTSILCDNREGLQAHLAALGIGSRLFFYPMHAQPCYRYMNLDPSRFRVTQEVYDRGLSLPSSYGLTDSEQARVINAMRNFKP